MEQKSRIRANVIKEARRALKGMAFSVVVGVALAASSVKADIPEIPVCIHPAGQNRPCVSSNGRFVVYADDRNDHMEDHDITLYAAELDPNTGVVLREFPICTDPLGQKHAAISGSGDIVVWQGHSRINEDTWTAGIWGFKIGTGQKFLINEGGYEPDISEDGKTVVWDFYTSYENGRDIFGAEIDPNTCEVIEEFPICTAYNGQAVPAISKNFIVWEDHRYYPLPYKPTSLVWPAIYGCDLETQKTFKVCTDPYVWHSYPDISNGSVVWVDTRAGDSHPGRVTNKDIYMAKIPDEMKEVDPDLNLDGIVDSKDFSIFSGSWLEGIRIVEPNESNEPRRR